MATIESIEHNAIYTADHKARVPMLPIDLSRDTYVNEIMARNGAPTNEDAEVFFIREKPDSQAKHFFNPR